MPQISTQTLEAKRRKRRRRRRRRKRRKEKEAVGGRDKGQKYSPLALSSSLFG